MALDDGLVLPEGDYNRDVGRVHSDPVLASHLVITYSGFRCLGLATLTVLQA